MTFFWRVEAAFIIYFGSVCVDPEPRVSGQGRRKGVLWVCGGEPELRGVDFRFLFGTTAGSEKESDDVNEKVFHDEEGRIVYRPFGGLDQEFVGLEDGLRLLHFGKPLLQKIGFSDQHISDRLQHA